MWTYKSLFVVAVVAVIVLLVVWWFLSLSAGVLSSMVVSMGCYFYVSFKHNETLRHSNNISLYDHDSFPWLSSEIRRHLVFKKCSFNHNRAFWLRDSRLDVLFYTVHCQQQKTIAEIMSRCFFDKRADNIDKFVELYLISMILREDVDLLTDFEMVEFPSWYAHGVECSDDEGREDEEPKNFICWENHLDVVGLKGFFESELTQEGRENQQCLQPTGLKPDVCLRLVRKDGTYTPVVIDVFNGSPGKKPRQKIGKYSVLKKYIEGLVVAVFVSNPQRSFDGCTTGYEPLFDGDSLDGLISITEEQKRHFSENTVKFLQEVVYWRLNKEFGEIRRSHR